MMDDGFSSFPLGLGMMFMMNSNARAGYDHLTEAEKEHIILKCKDARSKDEMERIVNSLAGDDVGDLLWDSKLS